MPGLLNPDTALPRAEKDDRRVDVLGVGISRTSPEHALGRIADWIAGRESRYICVTGVHGVMESQDDPGLMRIHNQSGLTIPDGMPMVWAGWAAGAREMRLMRGTDFTLRVCAAAAERGWSVYFYGGKEGVPERLAAELRRQFPGLEVAGTHSPPFREPGAEEDAAIIDEINSSGADIVFVGLSTPKQERWMADHAERLSAGVLIGVGAAFDVHSGTKVEAPRWLRPIGLEWLYRLIREPRRLGGRYASVVPRFSLKIARRRPFLRT